MINASFSNGWLVISGTPTNDFGSQVIRVTANPTETTVQDNNSQFVDLGENVVPNRLIDARGFSDGILVLGSRLRDGNVKLLGSDGDDTLFSFTSDLSTLNGGQGNDRLTAYSGDARLFGGQGNDVIVGGAGDDSVWGGRGNDEMSGGDGTNTLFFNGNFANYTLEIIGGRYVITDNVGNEGTDTFNGFSMLQFADQSVEVDPELVNIQTEINGTTLVLSGDASNDSTAGLVRMTFNLGSVWITDNDAASTRNDVQNAPVVLTGFDGRGFGTAGVSIDWVPTEDVFIRGTRFGDVIALRSASDDVITAKGGDDSVIAGGGDDVVTGGRGDDTLDGGTGTDTIVFSGEFAEYDLELVQGNYVITHIDGGKDGTDLFSNFEFATFADQIIAIDSSPSNTVAEIVGQRFIVDKDAVTATDTNVVIVRVEADGVTRSLADDGLIDTFVDVAGPSNTVRVIDVSGVEVGGSRVTTLHDSYVRLIGSELTDFYLGFGDGPSKIAGNGGNDILITYNGNDSIYGGSGNDLMRAGAGDDLLLGGDGDDRIEGGFGEDVMVMRSDFADYVVTEIGNGLYFIEQTAGNLRDGKDTFFEIETLQFRDVTIGFDDLVFG